MADNITLNTMTGGPSAATDDIAGNHYQRIKLIHGADGVNAGDVSSANPLPVNLTSATKTIDTYTTPLGISGTYTSPTFDHGTGGTFITHYVFADQDGTHYHEVSHDGTNWQIADTEPVTASTALMERHEVQARYSRLRYVNGAVAQGVFYHQGIQKFFGSDEYVKIHEDQNRVKGENSNNSSAPVALEQLGVLPAIASAAAQSYTEGNQVLQRTNLAGDTAVTLDGEVVVLGAGAANIGDVDILTIAAGDNNIGNVDIVTMPNAVVAGDVAHDGIDSGNPVKIGGIARNANPTSVANADRVNAMLDLGGRLITRANNPRGLRIRNTITLTTTTETTLLAAAASTFHDVTKILVSNTSATAVRVDFRDSTAGSVMMSLYVPAGQIIGFTDSNDPVEQTTVNNNWTAQLSAVVTDVRIFAQAVKNVA